MNREKIGFKQRRILGHNDIISVSHPACKAFVYKDQRRISHELPSDITSKYYIGKKLGCGASGTVFLVHNYKTCKMFALKHIKKSGHFNNRPQEATLAVNEATIMKSLQHPCVVQMADIIETTDSMFILLELMNGGDLLTRIQEHTFLPESLAKFYFYQICHAIKVYLNSISPIHSLNIKISIFLNLLVPARSQNNPS